MLSIGTAGLPIVGINAADDYYVPFLYDVGTCFEIGDSPYLNITLLSTEVVRVLLMTGPGAVSFVIESNCSAASTTMMLRGLGEGRTYSRYEDGYMMETFTTDSETDYTFSQQLSEAHHITIQEGHSTIYILSDGTVSPPSAPLSVDGNVYTFTSNIYESIIVQKNNIILDGNGYTLQGPGGTARGVYLADRSYVAIRNITVCNWWEAISLYNSHNVEIRNNIIRNNLNLGILLLYNSDSNKIIDNVIKANMYGIGPVWSSNLNLIEANDILDHSFAGVYPYFGGGENTFYHNDFVNNRYHLYTFGDVNVWDNGYPSGGNYWSSYQGADSCNGPNQNEAGPDGIGDTPYTIRSGNVDHYPITSIWTPVPTSMEVSGRDYGVTIVSDAQIDHIVATKNNLHFEASGQAGDAYTRVIFPMVNTTNLRIFVDGALLSPPPFPVIKSNGTHYFIYFEFGLSSHTIAIQFAPVELTLDVAPSSLNLISMGEWITGYFELPEGFDISQTDVSTILLNKTVRADMNPTDIGDYDNDGIPDLMVKFNRIEVITLILANVDTNILSIEHFMTITFTATGELYDDTLLQGTDTLRIICHAGGGPGKQAQFS